MSQQPLTLEAFQQHIHRRYYQADSTRGTAATFMWFIEEVGELATALHGGAGVAKQAKDETGRDEDKEAARENLEEEFADVLAWLCTLANINQVDLAQAVRKKYLTGAGPTGHK